MALTPHFPETAKTPHYTVPEIEQVQQGIYIKGPNNGVTYIKKYSNHAPNGYPVENHQNITWLYPSWKRSKAQINFCIMKGQKSLKGKDEAGKMYLDQEEGRNK